MKTVRKKVITLCLVLLGLSLLTNCSKKINCDEFDINYNRVGCFRV